MEERYIASLDLGTSKFALAVARINGDDVQVLFYREAPSAGVRDSAVWNPKNASVPVKELVRQAEEELGIKILQVVVGMPRWYVRQESQPGKIERNDPDSCIEQEEIDFIKSQARENFPLENTDEETIYDAVAQSFSTDGEFNFPEEEIVGSVSPILEGNFKIFIGKRRSVTNIDKLLQEAGLARARTYFIPELISEAILSSEEKENGVALVEMGAGVTSVTIYQNMILRHYGAVPFGARSITTDIKHECGFTESLSENIKLAFGACLPEKLQSMSEKIIQINDNENGTYKQLSVKYLSEIINARQREIFEAILYIIGQSGYSDRLRGGIVITGGGAELTNCANLLKEMSGYNVRTGYPNKRKFTCGEYSQTLGLSTSASLGMILKARNDTHLNCIDKPSEPVEPQVEEQQEETVEDTVFTPQREASEEKVSKPAKTPKKPKSPKKRVIWEKIEGVLGNLYDSNE